jgi:uncharacterized protein related to proFAR isomerase
MDFVFMLTRSDRTIPDALEVLDEVRELGLRHIGFKDVGASPEVMRALNAEIHARGAISYLEIVSLDKNACLAAARLARELGIDHLLGGTAVDDVLEILRGSAVGYLPFPGRPFDHPTKLAGSPADIAADCRRYRAAGCAGVDLLAYRATEAEPVELVRAARAASDGTLLVAGGVRSPDQIRELAAAGADAFTVGSAVLDGSFAPSAGSLRSQLEAVLDACR